MPWNAQIQNQLAASVNDATSQANTSLNTIINQSERAALNLPGAQDQISLAKQNVESKIQTINNATKTINDIIDELAVDTEDIRSKMRQKQETNESLKTTRQNAKVVADLRNEQVQELKNKNEGNYHTSWLGLWRPLAPESRTGLFIASIVLGVIGLLSIVFLSIEPVGKMLPAQTQSFAYRPTGGFLSLKKK